jgi:hypothetical protein
MDTQTHTHILSLSLSLSLSHTHTHTHSLTHSLTHSQHARTHTHMQWEHRSEQGTSLSSGPTSTRSHADLPCYKQHPLRRCERESPRSGVPFLILSLAHTRNTSVTVWPWGLVTPDPLEVEDRPGRKSRRTLRHYPGRRPASALDDRCPPGTPPHRRLGGSSGKGVPSATVGARPFL